MEVCSEYIVSYYISDGCICLCVLVCIIAYFVNLPEDLELMSFMENMLDKFLHLACHEFSSVTEIYVTVKKR